MRRKAKKFKLKHLSFKCAAFSCHYASSNTSQTKTLVVSASVTLSTTYSSPVMSYKIISLASNSFISRRKLETAGLQLELAPAVKIIYVTPTPCSKTTAYFLKPYMMFVPLIVQNYCFFLNVQPWK